jgi:macrolide-specific efflux system membrane fusion protein
MTVAANISEADIGDIKAGMDVYFTTLGGRQRRWYSQVRQILPTPVIENNVVLYTGLFDIENLDAALLPEMTAQVYFVTASARDVLTVPMGALTFMDRPTRSTLAAGPAGQFSNPQTPAQRREQLAQVQAESGPEPETLRQPGARRADSALTEENGPRTRTGRGGRPALVTVVDADGSQREAQILIGVSSRISAEVIDGLAAGDRVVAGIIQGQNQTGNRPPNGFGQVPRRPPQ